MCSDMYTQTVVLMLWISAQPEKRINLYLSLKFLLCWYSITLWGMFKQIINSKPYTISLLRKLVSKKLVPECNVGNMELPLTVITICVLGAIQSEDCCAICYERTLVQKPSKNEDLPADYHPMCLKFNVILMVQVGLKYNFNFISSHIPATLSNRTEKIHTELNALIGNFPCNSPVLHVNSM